MMKSTKVNINGLLKRPDKKYKSSVPGTVATIEIKKYGKKRKVVNPEA